MIEPFYESRRTPVLFYWEKQHDDELRRLHAEGMTDAQITEGINARFGLTLAKHQIASRRARLFIRANVARRKGGQA